MGGFPLWGFHGAIQEKDCYLRVTLVRPPLRRGKAYGLLCRYESCDCVGFTSLSVIDFGPEVAELRTMSEVCILAPLPRLAPVSVQLLSFREKLELPFR